MNVAEVITALDVIQALALIAPEDAAALLAEMDRVAARLEMLVVRINVQNLATEVSPGVSMTAALVITVGVGWWRFSRGRRAAPRPSGGGELSGEAEERLASVERRLDALARALRD